jgi:cell wall-associated NlpC family hydrolase
MELARARGLLWISLVSALMSACSMAVHRAEQPEPVAVVAIPAPAPERANEVLVRALGLIGTRYRHGGNRPDEGFDCSGLVGFVFADAAGVALPRSSAAIGELDAQVVDDELAGGDIVLFAARGRVNHVGIYVGDGRFVHSPKHGQSVRLDRLDGPYWREHYAGARRVL